jgi:hypothetical protein
MRTMTGWPYIPPQDGICPGSKVQGWHCRSRSQVAEVRILVLPWMGGDGVYIFLLLSVTCFLLKRSLFNDI